MRLIELIRTLIAKFPGINIVALLTAIAKLFPMPDLANEAGCRQWCRTALGVADELAEITPSEIDDQAVAAGRAIVEDDQLWALAWQVKSWLIGTPDPILVSGAVGAPPELMLLARRLNIDWQKLLDWAMKILPLIFPLVLADGETPEDPA